MKLDKKVSRLLAMVMAIAMCLSLSISAFATEPVTVSSDLIAEESSVAETYAQIVANHVGDPVRGSRTYRICPEKGQVLKLRIDNSVNANSQKIIVKVTKNGGWWPSKTVEVSRGQAGTTYTLISNCNGEVYTVEFEADPGYFSAVLYANVS